MNTLELFPNLQLQTRMKDAVAKSILLSLLRGKDAEKEIKVLRKCYKAYAESFNKKLSEKLELSNEVEYFKELDSSSSYSIHGCTSMIVLNLMLQTNTNITSKIPNLWIHMVILESSLQKFIDSGVIKVSNYSVEDLKKHILEIVSKSDRIQIVFISQSVEEKLCEDDLTSLEYDRKVLFDNELLDSTFKNMMNTGIEHVSNWAKDKKVI